MIKNSFIYLGASLLNNSMPFLLLPVLTKHLSTYQYGKLSLFLVMISLCNAFVGMNIGINISKNFFAISKEELAQIIGNIIFILMLSSLIMLCITWVVYLNWETVFSIPTKLLFVLPGLSFLIMVNTLNLTILRNEGQAFVYGFFEICITLVNAAVTLLLLIEFSWGWYAQIAGLIVSNSVFCIVALVYMNKCNYILFKINVEKIKSILLVSIPMISHVLGGIIINLSDRLYIERMINIESVALYSIGYSFGMVIKLFIDAFIKSWSPWFYKNVENTTVENKRKIVKYTYQYILGVLILVVLISVAAKVILPFMVTESFFEAKKFIIWVSLGYAMQGIYKIFFPYLVHINRTSFLGLNTMLAAILNLGLNYLFILRFGSLGAAYATVISFAFSAILIFWYQNKNYPMPWLGK